nr:MAG TPA: hypothetical protein [Caudoviricetes sp.]
MTCRGVWTLLSVVCSRLRLASSWTKTRCVSA